MDELLKISGIILWAGIVLYIIARLFYGKRWLAKLGGKLIFGDGPMDASKKLVKEVRNKSITDQSLGEFATYIIWRFTRIGVFALLIAVLPIWLLYNQNRLLKWQNEMIDLQNERLNFQNNLVEAQRRSALLTLMSDVMNQMNEEISEQRALKRKPGDNWNPEGQEYELSSQLIGRIASLSEGFLPYRILEGDTLSKNLVSPERGQLLLAIAKSSLTNETYKAICQSADFTYADLRGADLTNTDLDYVDFSNAYLQGVDLSSSFLVDGQLSKVNLNEANLSGAALDIADLEYAILENANFDQASLNNTFLNHAVANNTSFKDASFIASEITNTNLKNADLSFANFEMTFLDYSNLENAIFTGTTF